MADIKKTIQDIKALNLKNFSAKKGNLEEMSASVDVLLTLAKEISDVASELKSSGVKETSVLNELLAELSKLPDKLRVSPPEDRTPEVVAAVNKLGKTISQQKTVVNVPQTKVDLSPLQNSIEELVKVAKQEPDFQLDTNKLEKNVDEVKTAVKAVEKAINSLRFPVSNYVLPFKTQTGKDTQVKLNDDGSLPITASISTGALATSAIQTDGSQKTQIVDSGGEAATVTGGKLDVNATASLAGTNLPISGATSAVGVAIVDSSGNQISSFGGGTQYTEDAAAAANPVGNALIVIREDGRAGSLTTTDGDNVALRGNNLGELYVKHTDNITVNAHAVTNAGTFAVQATLAAETTKVIGTVNQGTSPWVVSGAVTNTVLSVVGGGTEATAQRVTLASDSTGVLTVKQATAGNLNATVVGTGTFAVQATLAAETTKVIGTVNQGTSPWVVSGSVTANAGTNLNTSALALESGGNLATIAALSKAEDAAHSSGNTGIMALAVRNATVTDLSAGGTDGDYEPLQVSATGRLWASATIDAALPAGANVIGHVIADTGSTTAVTGNVTVVQGTGSNLHTVLDSGTLSTITNVVHVDDNSGSLTVDAPVATPVFTRLSDGAAALIGQKAMTASLPVVLSSDQTSIPVAATQSGNWTSRVVGNIGATLDAVVGAGTAPTNMLAVGGVYNSSSPTLTNGQSAALQLDSSGNLKITGSLSIGGTTDGAAFTAASSTGTPIMGAYDDINSTLNVEQTLDIPRISANRNQYVQLRDGSGSERGANVDQSNRLSVSVNNSPNINLDTIAGSPVATTQPGIQLASLADELGNVIGSTGSRLNVHVRGTQDATEYTVPTVPYFNSALLATVSLVKPGRTNLYYANIINTNAVNAYVQVFDVPSATKVSLGSTVPTEVWFIPAGGAWEETFIVPLSYLYGIQLAATTTATGSTAPSTGLVVNLRTTA